MRKGPFLPAEVAIYDVFAEHPFNGNQAAVIHEDRRRFSDRQLLALAAELSFPETALSATRGRHLTLRFANADRLLKRCGHATLASVADHVFSRILHQRARNGQWTGQYGVDSTVAEWRATVSLRRGPGGTIDSFYIAVAWPERPKCVGFLPARAIYHALGIEPLDGQPQMPVTVYDSGNRNALVPVGTVASLERAMPDSHRLAALCSKYDLTDVHLYTVIGHDRSRNRLRLRCRNVFPYGVFEETATGTASVSLAASLIDHFRILAGGLRSTQFLFDQGAGNRRGKIYVNWCPTASDDPRIWLEGWVFPIVRGSLISIPKIKSH
jgi:PhzF family phenazine biosynthesis protein